MHSVHRAIYYIILTSLYAAVRSVQSTSQNTEVSGITMGVQTIPARGVTPTSIATGVAIMTPPLLQGPVTIFPVILMSMGKSKLRGPGLSGVVVFSCRQDGAVW